MTPREAALRVTVLDAIKAAAEDELAEARAGAETAFRAAVESTGFRASTGALQVPVELPGGQVIGHLSVKAGAKTSETDEAGLHEWVAERNTEALEPYVLPLAADDEDVLGLLLGKCPDLVGLHLRPGALEDPRVLELLASEFPHMVSSRVRSSALKAYVTEAAKVAEGSQKGWLVDQGTGERLHLVTETQEPATGAFQFIGAETPERRRQVMAALAAGDPVVRSIAFGAVAELAPAAETRQEPAGGAES
jgi:hypothetical protein